VPKLSTSDISIQRKPMVRLLPALGIVASLSLLVTAGTLVGSLSAFIDSAQAETAKPAPAKPAVAAVPVKASRPAASASRSEVELVTDLANRRKALDEQVRKLDLRERLLDAAEKRLDGKMAELRKLETSLKQLSVARDEETNKQMASLVKMYETMKPKDAARIFERLDLSVQLAVATRMKEAKMAAILADMSPDVAKVLTTALASKARSAMLAEPSAVAAVQPPATAAKPAATPAKAAPAAKPAATAPAKG
jgi:flagellar motility protein MotE (MotC chaperone)